MVVPDPLHLIIAFGPLVIYLLPMGFCNLARRPTLTTGARDAAWVGIAISGFVFAGPMELFMPEATAATLRGFVWLLLFALYGLCVTLIVLTMRPKLIVYNMTLDQLRPILADVVSRLDNEARWAGDNLILPNLCVQLHVEQSLLLRTSQLVATGASLGWQTHEVYLGWRRLEIALRDALQEVRVSPNPLGIGLLLSGLSFAGLITFFLTRTRPAVTQALWEMLRL